MNQPELITDRLLLRSFETKDAQRVQALAGNNNVSKTTLNIPYPYENGMAEAWIESHHEDWKNKSRITYAITNNKTNQLIGAVSLVEIIGMHAELGYWIGEPYWNKGYCTEAANALIKYSFTELGIKNIIAEHLSSNIASGKVMKKLGMAHIATKEKENRMSSIVTVEVYEIQNT